MVTVSSELSGTITTDPQEYFGFSGPCDLFVQVVWAYSAVPEMELRYLIHSSLGKTAIFAVDGDEDHGAYLLFVSEVFEVTGDDEFWAAMEQAFEEA